MLELGLDLPPAVEPLHLGGLATGSERARHLAKMLLRRRRRVWWGRLRRMQPVSDDWGLERGTPVDRVYIEQFLERHAGDVRGRVLEIRVVLTSLAFLIGAAEVDLRRAELSFEDEDFPLVACARARKLA